MVVIGASGTGKSVLLKMLIGLLSTDKGTITFDGSRSSDPDGDSLAFAWQFGDGGTSTARQGTHTYTTDGSYTISLAVTDSKGLASTAVTTSATVAKAPVLVGAGNIATCGSDNDLATAFLIDSIPGTVFTLGDNAYPRATATDYANCYAPTWGRFKKRTRPVPGNHEFQEYTHDTTAASATRTKKRSSEPDTIPIRFRRKRLNAALQ